MSRLCYDADMITTLQEAALRKNEILCRLGDLGYYSVPGQFSLSGGDLHVEKHPELGSWRVLWKPHDARLLPLDLTEYQLDAAAEQIGRYKLSTYTRVLRRYNLVLEALHESGLAPMFRDPRSADTFFANGFCLSIQPRIRSSDRNPEYFIELIDTMPLKLRMGEVAPASNSIDVTEEDPIALTDRFRRTTDVA